MWIKVSALILCIFVAVQKTKACYIPSKSNDVKVLPCSCTTENLHTFEETTLLPVEDTRQNLVEEDRRNLKETGGEEDRRNINDISLLGGIDECIRDGLNDGETLVHVKPQRRSSTRNWSLSASGSESSYPPGANPISSSSGGTLTQTANGSTSLSLNSCRGNTGKVTTRHCEAHSGSSSTGLQGPLSREVVIKNTGSSRLPIRSYSNRDSLRGRCVYQGVNIQ